LLILSKKAFVVFFCSGGVTVAAETNPFIDEVAYVSVLLIRSKKAFVVFFFCGNVAGAELAAPFMEEDVKGTGVTFPFIVDVAYVSLLLRRSKKALVVFLTDAGSSSLVIEVRVDVLSRDGGVIIGGMTFPFIVLVA